MKLLYSFGNWIYYQLSGILGLFSEKPKLFYQGRKKVLQELATFFRENTSDVAWFHAASLGEFEQGRPVMEAFKKEFPEYKILLTFYSPSGYEVRKKYQGADFICYLPIDTKQNASEFIKIVQPKIAYFIKYEFWFHYINELKKQQIPIVSFSSIFREKQLFFKRYGGFYRNILKNINAFFVQDEVSYQLLKSINITEVTIAGDSRFDRVRDIVQNIKKIELAEVFKNGEKLLVIGSSWEQDMEVIGLVLNEFQQDLKIIIASHEIDEKHLSQIENIFSNKKTIRFSKAEIATIADYEVLIIDNIGMLSSLYQYGEITYIGGAFGKGLHNILEAATFGMPVIFGTNYHKFKEAKDLISEGGAFSVSDNNSFQKKFEALFKDDKNRISSGKIASSYVAKNTGATDLILKDAMKRLK